MQDEIKMLKMDRINRYETIFIVDAGLPEEEVKAAADKFINWLKEHGAKIVAVVDWGRKKFAYPIKKKEYGRYFVVEFDAPRHLIHDLETEYLRDERILRFLTTKLDKYAIEWNERWRKRIKEEQTKSKRSQTAKTR